MKNLFTLALSMFLYLGINAQNKNLTIEIPRDDYSTIKITAANENYTLTNSPDLLVSEGEIFRFDYGKGGKKDVNGRRERQKRYLTNSNNDTIATVLSKESKIFIGNTTINILRTDNGWKYTAQDGTEYCDLELYWNKKSWKYDMTMKQNNHSSTILERVIISSLIETAEKESKCDSDDDSAIFTSLYLLCIIGQ